MIDFKTAENLLFQSVSIVGTEQITLSNSEGRILAEDIYASIDHPLFDQSAVDGYLIYYADKNKPLKVVDEIAAGSFSSKNLHAGEAMRIFTGAPIPNSGDTVVMQEYVSSTKEKNSTFIKIKNDKITKGGNIRKKGGQLKKGDITLKKGSKITASSVGFLASIGIQKIQVYRKPIINIIVTGNEFADFNEPIKPGKIYESNGVMLQAALANINIQSNFETATDELSKLSKLIQFKTNSTDILIITGGVSVGDYDFTKPALLQNGFETVFHKVKQKPGKPFLLMKRKDGKIAFGLPGNPRSAMIGYYMYILPYLNKMMGASQQNIIEIDMPIGHTFSKKEDQKTHFVAGTIENNQLFINKLQASHMMLSMANASVIAILPEQKLHYKKGDLVCCRFIV